MKPEKTEASMVMLHFLKWLQVDKPKVGVDVLACAGGGLEGEFIKNCNTFYSYPLLTKPKPLKFLQRSFF